MANQAKIVDLSHLIQPSEENPYADPYSTMTSIDTHATVDADGFFECHIFMSDHTCTHIESNLHFNPKGTTIDEMPLDLMYSDAVVLDFSHIEPGEDITKSDLKSAAEAAKVDLKKEKIVLIRTDFYKTWGTAKYTTLQPNLLPNAGEWLVNLGVRVIGVDALVPEVDRSRINSRINPKDMRRCWPLHALFTKYDFYILERMANLDRVPSSKFKLIIAPLRFARASASPIRALAIVEGDKPGRTFRRLPTIV